MFRFVVLCALVGAALGGVMYGDLDGRIVNGVDTTIQAHPYQVSIQTTSGFHFCGGSIIDEDTIVTAAHCLQTYSVAQMRVRLGTTDHRSGGDLVAVKAFTFHPGYNSKTMVNDVGIVKLATPVRQSSTVRYVPLATITPKTGTPAVVTGWGTTCFIFCGSPTTLQEVDVDIVGEQDCASSEYKYGAQIEPSMVCAYAVNKDACQGDSGGPLVAEGKLVGIVSWGRGCAKVGYPGVYCDVPSMRAWILENAASL